MGAEERILEAFEEDGELEFPSPGYRAARHERLESRNRAAIERFLGRKKRAYDVAIMPRYYGELLTWALGRYLENEQWKVVQTLGYHGREPVYIDVNTDCGRQENRLMNGQLLVQRGEDRLILTVDINPRWRGSVLVEGPGNRKKLIGAFAAGVLATAKSGNFYRGKELEFAGSLRFLDTEDRSWDSIILNDAVKREIMSNTVDFLARTATLSKFGIPPRRGILLAGEPGTGKTVICKALMSLAEGITCITASAYAIESDDYITELYELAQDLAPCLVFIEDIDLIGQNREEFGYKNGPTLLSLLNVLDGIEEKKEVVTIATTNFLEVLDKALAQRPARFDRVIRLTRPDLEERQQIVRRLCGRIPLEESVQDFITRHSEGCTPAQLQEIVYSLVIEHGGPVEDGKCLAVSNGDIEHVIARINGRNRSGLGFRPGGNGHDAALGIGGIKG